MSKELRRSERTIESSWSAFVPPAINYFPNDIFMKSPFPLLLPSTNTFLNEIDWETQNQLSNRHVEHSGAK